MSQGSTKGVPIDVDSTLALNSDLVVPSQKAIKTYVAAYAASVAPNVVVKEESSTLITTSTLNFRSGIHAIVAGGNADVFAMTKRTVPASFTIPADYSFVSRPLKLAGGVTITIESTGEWTVI